MESEFQGPPKLILIKINPHPNDNDQPMTECCDVNFSKDAFKEKEINNAFKEKEINIINSFDLEIPTKKDKSKDERHKSFNSLSETISSVSISFLKFVFTKIFSIHIFVMLLTICQMSIQDYVNQFCWFQNACNCYGNLEIKIYSSLIYILLFFNLLCFTYYITGLEIIFRTSPTRIIIKYVYYFTNFFIAFVYLVAVNESDMVTFPIILINFSIGMIFQIKFLFDKNFRGWLIFFAKVNTIPILFFTHYLLCRFGFPLISNYFIQALGNYDGKNFNSMTYFLYFKIYSKIFPKLCCIYHNYIRSLGSNECFATITLIRFSLVFSLSVPISSIINMDKNDWGCWILLISYTHFLISWYTRWDLFGYFLEKAIKKIFPNKKIPNQFNSKFDLECKQLISGCLLDMLFIVNFRFFFFFFFF